MAVAWFLVPYKERSHPVLRPFRYCAMDDFTPQIVGVDGGDWSESEVLGNHAVVKVRATDATLSSLETAPGFLRLPGASLAAPLSGLNVPQKKALKDKLVLLGYSGAEIDAAFPNDLGSYTVADVLRFAATRRRKPRWDDASQTIKVDGAVQRCRDIGDVDRAVSAQPLGQAQLAVLAWTSFLSGLYFGSGFRPARLAIQYFAQEAARLGLAIEEHSYDFLAWVGQHSSMLLFRLFGAFPTTGVLDTFTGADETPIATNWSGPIISGDLQLRRVSNQLAHNTSDTAGGSSYYDLSTFGPNSECYITIPTFSSDDGASLHPWLRMANPGVAGATDGYLFEQSFFPATPDRLRIKRVDNDVGTQLGGNITAGEYGAGDSIGSEIIGSTLQHYRRPRGGSWGTYGTSRSDSTYSGAGYIGLSGFPATVNSTMRFDDFGGGTVVVAAMPPPSSMFRGMFVGMNRRLTQV